MCGAYAAASLRRTASVLVLVAGVPTCHGGVWNPNATASGAVKLVTLKCGRTAAVLSETLTRRAKGAPALARAHVDVIGRPLHHGRVVVYQWDAREHRVTAGAPRPAADGCFGAQAGAWRATARPCERACACVPDRGHSASGRFPRAGADAACRLTARYGCLRSCSSTATAGAAQS